MFLHKGIGIRAIEEEDLEFLKAQRNDPSTWMQLSSIEMLNTHSQKEWLASLVHDSSRRYFVAFENEPGCRIGLVRCDQIDHLNQTIRIGADIAKELRGQGYGKRLYELLLHYCFDFLNMNRVWLLVLSSNVNARHLYLKMGFKDEGAMRQAIYRNGYYRDYLMMSLLREEYYETAPGCTDLGLQ